MGRSFSTYYTSTDVLIAMQPPIKVGRPDRQRALAMQPVGESTLIITATVSATVTTLKAMGLKISWAEDEDPPNKVEMERTTRTKRITNPSDSEQYVDVEVIDRIKFKDSLGDVYEYSLDNG